MDPLILARIHFSLAATFHFIFPAATIGLALLILLFQTLYLLKKEKIYDDISHLLTKLLAVIFVIGVVT